MRKVGLGHKGAPGPWVSATCHELINLLQLTQVNSLAGTAPASSKYHILIHEKR